MRMEAELEEHRLKEAEVERKSLGQMVKNRMIKMAQLLKIMQETLTKTRMTRRPFLK